MSTYRRSDTVADTVLAGDAAGLRALGRPDLAAVADALAPLRQVAQDGPVQPTPALAALLEHGTRGLVHAPGAAPHTPHPGAGRADRHGRHVTASTTRRNSMLTEWLGGLGLAAKLSVASAVAAASVGVTGAAGVLPTPVQHTFDQAVSHVTPFGADDATDPATGIDVETDAPSDAATTDPSNDATPGAGATSDEPTTGTTDDSSSASAEPSDDDSASPDDEATDDQENGDDQGEQGDDGEDHHSSTSGDDEGSSSGRHRRHRGSDGSGGSGTSGGSRSDDGEDGSGSHETSDGGDRSGRGGGGDSSDGSGDSGGHGGDSGGDDNGGGDSSDD